MNYTPIVQQDRGLSLVEILIATAVATIGILGVLSAYIFGTTAVKTGKMTSEATNHARQILEHVRINSTTYITDSNGDFIDPPPSGFNDADTAREVLDSAPFDSAGLPANANYTRNVLVTYPAPNIAQIRVRIYWNDRQAEKFVELVALQGGA